jgi:hypothetical protein
MAQREILLFASGDGLDNLTTRMYGIVALGRLMPARQCLELTKGCIMSTD